jgi:hypothetical protein
MFAKECRVFPLFFSSEGKDLPSQRPGEEGWERGKVGMRRRMDGGFGNWSRQPRKEGIPKVKRIAVGQASYE